MSPRTNYIVYLCYGPERVFYECAMSLLSFSQVHGYGVPGNTEIWIYTDKPGWFGEFKDCPLPLHYRTIDDATIKEWRGKIDFVHRVKIAALIDLVNVREGNILYVDTDTVFKKPIDDVLHDIDSGGQYMHMNEGVVREGGTPILRKLNKHLKKNKQTSLRDMAMWNAGVLGFNTTDKAVLDGALAFTDTEYPAFPKHIVEQFAFSVCLRELQEAIPYIVHYWSLKEADAELVDFFARNKGKSWEELVRCSVEIDVERMMADKRVFYEERGLLGRMFGREWRAPLYGSYRKSGTGPLRRRG